MKITAFNPMIITPNAERIVDLFKELGFEIHHNKKNVGSQKVNAIVMKDPNGFHIDVSQPEMELPYDVQAIRINVSDFEEAYELFMSHGFENFYGNDYVVTPSSKSAVLRSPSGLVINLVEHIKNHD